jgi:predicted outer membrane lipoprotein
LKQDSQVTRRPGAAPHGKESATMSYFSWIPSFGIVNAMRLDANGHGNRSRYGKAGNRPS